MPLRSRQAKKSSRARQQCARDCRSGASNAPSGDGVGEAWEGGGGVGVEEVVKRPIWWVGGKGGAEWVVECENEGVGGCFELGKLGAFGGLALACGIFLGCFSAAARGEGERERGSGFNIHPPHSGDE